LQHVTGPVLRSPTDWSQRFQTAEPVADAHPRGPRARRSAAGSVPDRARLAPYRL